LENQTPEHETLYDVEVGYQYRTAKYGIQANLYYMGYKNQLVLTGALNDVGSGLRTNVPDSYRMGVELQGNVAITDQLSFQLNATVSQNKIGTFEEIVYDYTNGFDIETNTFEQTDIAFSPWGIFSSELAYQPINNLNIRLLSKYVSRQFLDNTSDENRQIDGYFVSDLRVDYGFGLGAIKALNLSLAVNNVFDVEYSANGYTYNYIVGEKIVENFYYPQAGIHFLLGLSLKF
ncbi:MAG: TonB-dependent receptor, partial [Saprospiraceae bacterium]